jgi:prepilin-type N-terminal cleavage/methylation domain-containing protein
MRVLDYRFLLRSGENRLAGQVRCCHENSQPRYERLTVDLPVLRQRAFTLIEVMIAITLFSVVLFAIYSSWMAILRGSKAGLNAAAEAQRTRVALRALDESLSSAQLFMGNLRHYVFLADTSGDFAAISFVARLPFSFPGSGLFGGQTVRRVTFSVEPGTNNQHQLVLKQTPLLEPKEAAPKPYTIVLAPAITRFQLEFLETNRFEWVPEWPFTNQLPRMVRVVLGFGHKSRTSSQPEDISVQNILLSSGAIPRDVEIPIGRRGAIPAPGGPRPPVSPGQSPGAPQPR